MQYQYPRRQLSMYVSGAEGVQLEVLRQVLDPVQAGLIPAHVTLCREDEIGRLSVAEIEERLRSSAAPPITLGFGPPVTFQGHGILLPCVAGEQSFHQMRTRVLGTAAIRAHAPHITLAHPRNPPPSKGGLAAAMGLSDNLSFTFASIVAVEQVGAALPWRVLHGFTLPTIPPLRDR